MNGFEVCRRFDTYGESGLVFSRPKRSAADSRVGHVPGDGPGESRDGTALVEPSVFEPLGMRWGETTMKDLASKVRRFLASEDGPTAVEYAVMLALILVACITVVSTLGTNVSKTFSTVGSSVGS